MAGKRHRSYGSQVAFIDLLFNTLVGFVFLFILAFILINPIAKKSNVDVVAEFIVKVSWPTDSPDDVDLWMRDPLGNYVGFRSKDSGLMSLERDDLGIANDTVYDLNGNKITVNVNQETVTIRGIVPGEYILNVHYYADKHVDKNPKHQDYPVLPVQVQIEKINPYSMVFSKEVELNRTGQEVTVTRFTVTEQGKIENFIDLPYGIVEKVKAPTPRPARGL